MDAADVRNLYEAYRSVYQDREYLNEDVGYDLYEAKGEGPEAATPGTQLFQQLFRGNKKRRGSKEAPMDTSRFQGKGSKAKRRMHNEEVDLYDVVLDHLLDEGYCDDVDSAEIIMANMSEEWLDEIVEGFVSPYKTKPTYGNPQGTSPAMKAMQKSDELQRTEPGSPRQKMQTRRSQQMNRMFQAARRA